VAAFA